MAAQQALLTAPNRAIPGSQWGKVYPLWAPAGEEGTGLGQQEQSLRSAPIQFLRTHQPHPHRGLLWGEARGGEHPSSPVAALVGRVTVWGQRDRAGWHQQGAHGQDVLRGDRPRPPAVGLLGWLTHP